MSIRSPQTALVVLASLLAGLLPPPGWAKENGGEGEAPVAALVGFRALDQELEKRARTYLYDAFKDSKRVRPLGDSAVGQYVNTLLRETDKDSSLLLEGAAENYLKGRDLYERLSIGEAITSLEAATRGYREGIEALHDNRYLLLSHLYLGMALVILGDAVKGREYIRQMVVLDPLRETRKLPRSEYPPKIVDIHAEITREIVSGPNGTVTFATEPPGATVYFDAVPQPASPLELKGIPAGDHFVVFEKPGYRRVSRPVTVRAGANRVSAKLQEWNPLAPYAYGKRRDLATNDDLVRIGTDLQATLLILGHTLLGESDELTLTGQIYDTRSREFSRIVRVDAQSGKVRAAAAELARLLLDQLTTGGLVVAQIADEPVLVSGSPEAGSPLIGEPAPRGGAPEIFTKWWFWAIVGGVAAGAVTGVVLATSGSDANTLIIGNPLSP